MLILFMMHKFLVPTEMIDVATDTTTKWLKVRLENDRHDSEVTMVGLDGSQKLGIQRKTEIEEEDRRLTELVKNSESTESVVANLRASQKAEKVAMPVFLSAVNQDVLIETLQKHFDSSEKEEKTHILETLDRAKQILTETTESFVSPILSSFLRQSPFQGTGLKMQHRS